jgi:very-short-patch-repair endonuclease
MNSRVCQYCSKEFFKENGNFRAVCGHVTTCIMNPNRKETIKKISDGNRGKIQTEDHNRKISEGMKLAHAEGRAWNIGKSRWNNEKSYPEKFFTRVIENEFEDKNYSSEYNVGNYSIDFAWVDKKIAIEIDGDQHIRFQHQIDSDIRKDKLLTSEGWKVLRIRWKDMCNDAKTHIQIAKSFVH